MASKPKKLKKIPADLVSYIQIEGEAIVDTNDKKRIVSYAYGKLEIVDWYIALIDANSGNYAIPHTRDHLVFIRKQLQDAIKKIDEKFISTPSGPLGICYPEGYEG